MKTRIIALVLTVIFTFPAIASARPATPPPRYKVTELPALPGGENSGAYAINSHGWVVGWADAISESPSSQFLANHAVLWRDGQVTDLGLLKGAGYEYDVARGINDQGQIVGGWAVIGVGAFAGYHPSGAFLWDSGHLTIFDERLLPPSADSKTPYLDNAVDINDKGQIAGQGCLGGHDFPAIWQNNTLEALPLPVGDMYGSVGKSNNFGAAINDTGDVVGTTTRAQGKAWFALPVLWHRGTVTDLGALPPPAKNALGFVGDSGEAVALNDIDQIVGLSNGQAFLWEQGKMRALLPLIASQPQCEALAINNHGWAVGDSADGEFGATHAVLWRDGKVYDLNTLVTPRSHWVLTNANGINDSGQIVGEGLRYNHPCAFVLSPILPATHQEK